MQGGSRGASRIAIALGLILLIETAGFAYFYLVNSSPVKTQFASTTLTATLPTGVVTTTATTSVIQNVTVTAGQAKRAIWGPGFSLPVGPAPMATAFDPANNDTYVANRGANYVSVVSPSGKIVAKVPTGVSPSSITYDSAAGFMVVANNREDSLTLISAANNTRVSDIPSGGAGPVSVAFNPVDGRIYVVNNGSATVVAINPTTGETLTVHPGADGQQIIFNPSDDSMYLTATTVSGTFGGPAGVVDIIAKGSQNVTRTLAVGHGPRGLAYDSVSHFVYVANCGDNTISLISSAGGVSKVQSSVGRCPTGVVYDPRSDRIFVSSLNDTIVAIDGRSNKIVSVIHSSGRVAGYGSVNPVANVIVLPVVDQNALIGIQLSSLTPIGDVGATTGFAAYDPHNKEMYVTDPGGTGHGDSIWVWNALTYQLVKQITFDQNTLPNGIAYNPSDQNMYVAVATTYGKDTGYVYVIDSSNKIVSQIAIGDALAPVQLAYDSNDGNIYVTVDKITGFSQPGFVYAVDTSGNIVAQIPVGKVPRGIAYDSASGYLYVANNVGGLVSLVSDGCDCIFNNVTLGGSPDQVVYDAKNNAVFVTDYYSGTVTAIFGAFVIGTFPGLQGIYGIAWNPADGYDWALDGQRIALIDGQAMQVSVTLQNIDPVYPNAQCLAKSAAFDPLDMTMWVVSERSGYGGDCGTTVIYTS